MSGWKVKVREGWDRARGYQDWHASAEPQPRLEVEEPEFDSQEKGGSVWTQSELVGRRYPTVQMQGSSGVTFYMR